MIERNEVVRLLYVGNADAAKDSIIRKDFADVVINVAIDLDLSHIVSGGKPAYHHVGLHDGPGNTVQSFIQCWEILAQAYDDHLLTLLCCIGGVSRSVSVAAGWVSYRSGVDLDAALIHVMSRRSGAFPRQDVMWQVADALATVRGSSVVYGGTTHAPAL